MLTPEEMELVPQPSAGTGVIPLEISQSAQKGFPASGPFGLTPFHLRDLLLLENHILRSSKTQYSVSHYESFLSGRYQLPRDDSSTSLAPDPTSLVYYQDAGWMGLMFAADRFRKMGGGEAAEKQLRTILGMLRRVQGPETDAVAVVLDHIGESFSISVISKGPTTFSPRRCGYGGALAALPETDAGKSSEPAADPRPVYRLHLAELLTRLGQLDLARAKLDLAEKELSEAVAISNESANLQYINSLFALYFNSILLETEGQWPQAEKLWQDAVAIRAPLTKSEVYWNALMEMAAFYARHGDFQEAAAVARKAQAATDRVHIMKLTAELPIPYISNRPLTEGQYLGREAREVAMSEILAIATWMGDGPEAATKLLMDPLAYGGGMLDRAVGPERARLLAWVERRVFLHLSMLLDENPSQERIKAAYGLLCKVKGRFLASESYTQLLQKIGPSDQAAALRIWL